MRLGGSTITKIITTFRTMSPRNRYAIFGYCGMALTHNFISSYNAGKVALDKYINSSNIDRSSYGCDSFTSEIDAIKKGISYNSFERFWASVFFPFTLMSEIAPTIVLMTNKKKPNE